MALEAISHSAARVTALIQRRSLPVFRYEDGFIDSQQTFDAVAEMLGVKLSRTQSENVLAALAPEAVRRENC